METKTMMTKYLGVGAFALALVAPVTVRAQDAGPSSEGVKVTAADEKATEDGGSKVDTVPGWSIKPEIQSLGESMKKFNTLIGSLNRANKDLSDEFQKYLKDPKNEVVASNLERKMAAYAAQVQGEFSA